MTTLTNAIIIDAPIEKIWEALSNMEVLDQYDPTVIKSELQSSKKNGVGATRKVHMKDGKNWFEEECTVSKTNEALTYELKACSFPVHDLQHTYSFERIDNKIKVQQLMNYQMKFGLLGKILDAAMVKRQSKNGIRQFLNGLKSYTEK